MKAEHQRDRSVDELLRRSLAAGSGGPPSPACLDAETLAGWMDGTLDSVTASAAEAHASSCARCQAMFAAMVRSAPDVVVATPWWRRDWNLRWVVPLTAATAALLLWTVVPDRGVRSLAVDQTKVESSTGTAAPLPPPPGEPATADRLETQTRADTSVGFAPKPPAKERRFSARDEEKQTRERRANAPTPQTPLASAEPDRRVASEAVSPVTGPISAAPPPSPSPASAAADTSLRRFGDAAVVGAASGARDILSPDPTVRWRIGPGGSVSFSTNAGATWELLPIGGPAELTAGSSPLPFVCWLVGRGGVVLRTTDGRRWERLPFPEAVDLASVQGIDAQAAVVTTSDGRAFRTADAGQTWAGGRR